MSFSVEGRTSIVTGASSGLGAHFASVLAGAGARVVLAARREEQLNLVAKEIEARGGTALVVRCDIAIMNSFLRHRLSVADRRASVAERG